MADITQQITTIQYGLLEGMPCTYFQIKGEGYSPEDHANLVKTVLDSGLKHVFISIESFIKNPLIKTSIQGLASKQIYITLYLQAPENISPLRGIKNLRFVLGAEPPDSQNNTINMVNINLLKEQDEIWMFIKNLTAYQAAKEFLVGKTITRPVVFFAPDFSGDDEEMAKVKSTYLVDSPRFKFKNRLKFFV